VDIDVNRFFELANDCALLIHGHAHSAAVLPFTSGRLPPQRCVIL